MFPKTTTFLSLLSLLITTSTAISLPVPRADTITPPCPPNQLHYHSTCIDPIPCGGLSGLSCPAQSQVCIDDPRDDCNPIKQGKECGGICVEPHPTKKCGGMLGLMCPEGWECVDDPRDECVPGSEGAEKVCMGVCV